MNETLLETIRRTMAHIWGVEHAKIVPTTQNKLIVPIYTRPHHFEQEEIEADTKVTTSIIGDIWLGYGPKTHVLVVKVSGQRERTLIKEML